MVLSHRPVRPGSGAEPANVRYEQADIFAWEPTKQFDLVSFTFWLSHVPPSEVDAFPRKVYRATKPDGRVWMVDSKRASTGTAADQNVYNEGIYQERTLNDGSTFEVVKVYYDAQTLRPAFERAGFSVEIRETPTYFVCAVASR